MKTNVKKAAVKSTTEKNNTTRTNNVSNYNGTRVNNSNTDYRNNNSYDQSTGYSQWLRQKRVFGYLHSVRQIPNSVPTKISATISVPQGEDLNREWEMFQVVISDYDARYFFEDYKREIEDGDTSVTVRFDVTNLRSKHFVVEEGQDEGKIVDCWGCTLTSLFSMSINGMPVYHKNDNIAMSAEDFYAQKA